MFDRGMRALVPTGDQGPHRGNAVRPLSLTSCPEAPLASSRQRHRQLLGSERGICSGDCADRRPIVLLGNWVRDPLLGTAVGAHQETREERTCRSGPDSSLMDARNAGEGAHAVENV